LNAECGELLGRDLERFMGALGSIRKYRVDGLTLVLLAVAVMFSAVGCHRQASSGDTRGVASGLDTKGIDFTTLIIVDDLRAASSPSMDSMISPTSPQFLEWTGIDQRVTAKEYESAYDANEIAADNRYKGKKLLVSGVLSGVEKDFTGSGFLDLAGTNPFLPGVHAGIMDASLSVAADMKKGQRLNLVCIGAGRVATIAVLNECQPMSDYVRVLTPKIKAEVGDALSGVHPLSDSSAKTVAVLYAMGLALPSSSPCLNGDADACKIAFAALAKDPTQKQVIQDHFKKALSGIEVAR
jgi:hypothetical protein